MIKHEKEYVLKVEKEESLSFAESLKKMNINFIKKEGNFLEFDLIGVDPSIANTLRRIIISEVPSIAAEKILVYKNSGDVPEEILANRIGLIPVLRDPECVHDLSEKKFTLKVKNKENKVLSVYSNDIEGEENFFKPNVLLTKLGPKQEIHLEIFCNINIGKDHAKYSPVSPATYRLMPSIKIGEIYDEEAIKLASLFPEGVIGLNNEKGRIKAYVKGPRKDFVSREVLRYNEFDNKVWIGREVNHFIFTIESIFMDSLIILQRAISILIKKAEKLKKDILKRDD